MKTSSSSSGVSSSFRLNGSVPQLRRRHFLAEGERRDGDNHRRRDFYTRNQGNGDGRRSFLLTEGIEPEPGDAFTRERHIHNVD